MHYVIGKTRLFFVLPYKRVSNNTFQSDRIGLNHLAFGVKTLAELKRFESALNRAKVKHSGIKINKYSEKEYIWFDDPDGIRLEFYIR